MSRGYGVSKLEQLVALMGYNGLAARLATVTYKLPSLLVR